MSFLSTLSAVSGAMSSAAGMLGSINQIFGERDDPLAAFDRQRSLMRENNDFQSLENQKSRDFTKSMYERQWQDVTSYNSYKEQVKRALDAGISPAALFQSGAPSSLGGISPASVGHSASPSPSYADVVNPVNRQAETFHSVSSGLQALSQATKLGFESSKIVPLMSAQIKNQLSSSGLNDIRQNSEDFELGLRRIYGSKLYDSQLGLQFAQMINAFNQAYLYAQEGKTQDSIRELNNADKAYKEALEKSTNKQREYVELQMSWFPREMKAKINNLNASSEEARASAKNLNATAEQTEFYNSVLKSPQVKDSLVKEARQAGYNAEQAGKMTHQQAEHMRYLVEQAAYATDMQEFTYWSNQVNSFVGTLGDAVSSFYGAGALRQLIQLRQGQMAPRRPIGFHQ